MEIRFLGTHNTESASTSMTSIIIDGRVVLDAGGLTSNLHISEQLQIEAVILTHAHYDHIRDIPILGMNMFLNKAHTVLYGHASIKDFLSSRLLDGTIYSDFFKKPADKPTFKFEAVEDGQTLTISGFKVKAIALPHLLPALAYALTSKEGKTCLFCSDTGPGIAHHLAEIAPNILIIECTATNRFQESIRQGGHLTASLIREELIEFRKITGYVPLTYCLHMNSDLETEIHSELKELANDGFNVHPAYEGLVINL